MLISVLLPNDRFMETANASINHEGRQLRIDRKRSSIPNEPKILAPCKTRAEFTNQLIRIIGDSALCWPVSPITTMTPVVGIRRPEKPKTFQNWVCTRMNIHTHDQKFRRLPPHGSGPFLGSHGIVSINWNVGSAPQKIRPGPARKFT
jgi:hypothetical protein